MVAPIQFNRKKFNEVFDDHIVAVQSMAEAMEAIGDPRDICVIQIMKAHVDRLNTKQLLNVAYQLEPREKKAVFKLINIKATEELIPDLIARTAGRDHAARVHIIEILSKFSSKPIVGTQVNGCSSDNGNTILC